MGKIPGVDVKATETGQKLLTAIPANFEPILEHYRSREVTVESFKDMTNLMAGTVERVGVLEEYSDKFILIRDVAVTDWLPPEALRNQDARDRFAVLLPAENPEPLETKGHVTMILNFFDELRRRIPDGK